MNDKILVTYFSVLITSLFAVCIGRANENTRVAASRLLSSTPDKKEKYIIDNMESVVTWKGSMQLAPEAQHTGYVSVSKGELMIRKGQLAGGNVEVDMNTIADKEHGRENGLVSHLKSADFFEHA